MGMAASQARFLGLTARRNNVEFEGQQINQQRTALANQSANYYNDLLGMSVPTPPSVDAFTKTVYTFNDGALTNSITSLIAGAGGKYTVSYLQQYDDEFSVVAAGYGVTTTPDNTKFFVGKTQLRKLEDTTPLCDYMNSLSTDQRAEALLEEKEWATQLNAEYGTPTNGWAVRYVENTSTGQFEPKFYNLDEVKGATYDNNGTSQSSIQVYTIGTKTKTNEIKGVDAVLEKDTTGRLINITLNPGSANEVTHALTTNTITDQQAYDDAMNQYEYEKHKYDQAIEEINAKIEIIQAQDKNLELRLKQLDTEHDAISNEMEAVQKVIEQNTQSSFKTFG